MDSPNYDRSLFEHAFDCAIVGMAVVDADSRCVMANTALCESLGYRAEELRGRALSTLIHPADLVPVEAQHRRLLSGAADRASLRVRCRHRHERMVLAQLSVCRLAMPDGGGVLLYQMQDLSERIEAELALSASERRFRRLAEQSVHGTLVARVEERFAPLFVNDAAARLFGFDYAFEALALPSLAELIPKAVQSAVHANWERLRRAEIDAIRIVVPRRRGKEADVWIEVFGTLAEWSGAPALHLTLIDVTEQQRLHRELNRLASTDALTELVNRREFMRIGAGEFRRRRSGNPSMALLMLDLDHFKRVNDTHGHACGDQVLRSFARTLRQALRDTDLAARLGGEEFAVLLPETDLSAAAEVAERLRSTCAETAITCRDSCLRVTVSIGVAAAGEADESLDALISRADKALYQAKARGRNAVALG